MKDLKEWMTRKKRPAGTRAACEKPKNREYLRRGWCQLPNRGMCLAPYLSSYLRAEIAVKLT
jgi:hypothetical protein